MFSPVRRPSLLAAALLVTAPVHAQLFRAYLSPAGSDANPCTLQAPCRLLPAALEAVADGGEIWMTGSANYNTSTVNIAKSVSILAVPGVVGSIVSLGGDAAVAITANDVRVALRNVAIGPLAGGTPGADGVAMTGASTLSIENSVIFNLPGSGVRVAGAGGAKIASSTLRNNGVGVVATGGANVDVTSSRLLDNDFHVLAAGGGANQIAIGESILSGGTRGLMAFALSGGSAHIAVTRSTISRTSLALDASADEGTSTILVSGSMIAHNDGAWGTGSGGAIQTAGDNQFVGNGPSFGALTPLPAQ